MFLIQLLITITSWKSPKAKGNLMVVTSTRWWRQVSLFLNFFQEFTNKGCLVTETGTIVNRNTKVLQPPFIPLWNKHVTYKNNMGKIKPLSSRGLCKNLSLTKSSLFIKNVPDHSWSSLVFLFCILQLYTFFFLSSSRYSQTVSGNLST